MKETVLAKELLNAVWYENITGVQSALIAGANPSWIFNGYPILIHAVYTQNKDIVDLLLIYGAKQVGEALGFALEYSLGRMIWPLAKQGVQAKRLPVRSEFGSLPSRFAPQTLQHS